MKRDPESISRNRARSLAAIPEKSNAEETLEVVVFVMANENYALQTQYALEVYPSKGLVSLPGTPPFVLGILNVRGEIISVIDLKLFFDLPLKHSGGFSPQVIICETEAMKLGISCEEVVAVRTVSRSRVHSPLSPLSGLQADYLMGVTSEPLIILEGGKILNDPSIPVRENI